MKVICSYKDIIKIGKQTTVIIWGVGKLGCELICELKLARYSDYYVSDSNSEKIEALDNHILPEEIPHMMRQHLISIVLTVKSDKSVNEIIEKINMIMHDTKGNCNVDIYHYIPETVEKMVYRRKEKGFFNGRMYRKAIEFNNAVNLLKEMITGSQAFLFARWGTVEGNVVYKIKAGWELLPEECLPLQQNAGVFPITKDILKSYCKIMENAAMEIDILCAFFWQKNLERWIEWYSPNAIIVSSDLEYPFFSNPWTKALEGMKVLVIHPYAKLIEKQYKNRSKLFKNDEILPEFTLITYQAVQSLGGNDKYRDWIEALNIMQDEISRIDFDIALIGCGAYGMPLGAFIKAKMHKKAIHMGGSLQILFGIKGKRWEDKDYDYQNKLYNEYWVRPTDDLKPKNYKNVEGGCYW